MTSATTPRSGRARACLALAAVGAIGVSGLVAAPSTANSQSAANSLPGGSLWASPMARAESNHTGELRLPDGRVLVVVADTAGNLIARNGAGAIVWQAGIDPHPGMKTGSDSSPAIGDITGDGVPEIVVGAGLHGPGDPKHHGGVVAFNADGTTLWRFKTRDKYNVNTGGGPDGYSDGVMGTPVIGDVDGDGVNDVVFGAFDHRVYALNGRGQSMSEPFDNLDTIFSTPALVDIDPDPGMEIIIGGDGTYNKHMNWYNHGTLRALNPTAQGMQQLWLRGFQDVVASTVVVQDINGDGRQEALFTTGDFYSDHEDMYKVWAVDVQTGNDVPGWPVRLDSRHRGSVSVGDVVPGGTPEIVVGDVYGGVYVYNGQGRRVWKQILEGQSQLGPGYGMYNSGITIADYDGNGSQDLFIANGWGGATVYRGSDGHLLATRFGSWHFPMSTQPSVIDFGPQYGRQMVGVGWYVGTPTSGAIYAAQLPATPGKDAWPTWNQNAARAAFPSSPRQLENFYLAKSLYKHMLGRTGSDGEARYWASRMSMTGSAAIGSVGFQDSVEYRSKRIDYFYRQVLQRDSVRPDEIQHHLNRLASGAKLDNIPREFMASREFYHKAGGTDAGFIDSLYRRALGRPAGASEVAAWTPVLNSQGPAVVINAIYDSPESARLRVNAAYQLWLDRTAGDSERAYWQANVINTGDEGMRHQIMISREYALKAKTVAGY